LPQRTPLYDWHVAHGGRMVDFAGWEMPIQYTSITEEHQAVRTSAGLFDISHMGRLCFHGPDALALVQRIWTNDAASMKPGQVRYGLVCREDGGILDDVLVYRFSTNWLMVVNASNREKIIRWLEQHRGQCNVRMIDVTTTWAMLAIQGPNALALVSALLETRAVRYNMPVAQLPYYQVLLPVERSDDSMIVSRTGYTGEDGFEISLPYPRLTSLVNDLHDAAARLGIDLKPCGLGARDTLRLEAAMPLYGHELSEEIDPLQAGLGWAVKLEKGDFIGREALQRRRDKPERKRVGLELEGKRIAREGAHASVAGKHIGQVTSGTFGPTVARAIAMAYVDPQYAAVGTACEVDVRGKPAPARVVPLPFYRRPRS